MKHFSHCTKFFYYKPSLWRVRTNIILTKFDMWLLILLMGFKVFKWCMRYTPSYQDPHYWESGHILFDFHLWLYLITSFEVSKWLLWATPSHKGLHLYQIILKSLHPFLASQISQIHTHAHRNAKPKWTHPKPSQQQNCSPDTKVTRAGRTICSPLPKIFGEHNNRLMNDTCTYIFQSYFLIPLWVTKLIFRHLFNLCPDPPSSGDLDLWATDLETVWYTFSQCGDEFIIETLLH